MLKSVKFTFESIIPEFLVVSEEVNGKTASEGVIMYQNYYFQKRRKPANFLTYFFIAFVFVIVGFLVSVVTFLGSFSVWFDTENQQIKEQIASEFEGFTDEIKATKATGELLEFSRANINPSDLRVSRELQWPLKSRITNSYSNYHQGIDIGAVYNRPIYPLMAGRVVKVVYNGANLGRYIEIQHKNGLKSLYAHLNIISVGKGQKVNLGTKIGSIGTTGYTTGPHLHLSVYLNGEPINPAQLLR